MVSIHVYLTESKTIPQSKKSSCKVTILDRCAPCGLYRTIQSKINTHCLTHLHKKFIFLCKKIHTFTVNHFLKIHGIVDIFENSFLADKAIPKNLKRAYAYGQKSLILPLIPQSQHAQLNLNEIENTFNWTFAG